ncbi:MAG: hypothetical protein KGJ89_00895 [Patescibacteria group bacterium]|nr:hypothetical protein [Patescibacteria group bacterium]MDE2015070.1 hypothetical protein [Patescibacteria group bacterium]MDE2226498.1 hypothetical protein [Patescibacteria group bacterium]
MDLLETLKKFKHIEPNQEFSKSSRILILNTPAKIRFTVWSVILKNMELGASLALAGLLIFMIVGGFSAWKFLAPLQVANLDPSTLRAEAHAIDIQIQLANLNYNGGSATTLNESTPQSSAYGKSASIKSNQGQTAPGNSTTTNISVDDALHLLSE